MATATAAWITFSTGDLGACHRACAWGAGPSWMARCRRRSWCGATAALALACWRSRARLQGPPALDAHAVKRRSAGLGAVGVTALGRHSRDSSSTTT